MIEERYIKFFKHDLEDVTFLVTSLLNDSPSEDAEDSLRSFCKLIRVELHEIVRKNEENLSDLKFKIFLNGLLEELSASNIFYGSVLESPELEHKKNIIILKQFNEKIYSFLHTYYYNAFPDIFLNTVIINEMLDKFEIDITKEKQRKFMLALLIADGSLHYDKNYFFYKGETFNAGNQIENITTIPRNYLLHTQQNRLEKGTRNIFTIGSMNILKYVIEKFNNEQKIISPFFQEKFENIKM